MEIVGKVIQILPLQQGTSQRTNKPWMIQSFIIETQEQYPRKVCIEMFGEDRIKSNPVAVDQVVTVFYDLESREFNGRWYTSVRAWKVEQGDSTGAVAQPAAAPVEPAAAQPAPAAQPMQAADTQSFDAVAQEDDGTDLPF